MHENAYPSQEPPFPAVDCFREARPVEVKGYAGTGPGNSKG